MQRTPVRYWIDLALAAGFTIRALASALGVPESTVYSWSSDLNIPSPENMRKLRIAARGLAADRIAAIGQMVSAVGSDEDELRADVARTCGPVIVRFAREIACLRERADAACRRVDTADPADSAAQKAG